MAASEKLVVLQVEIRIASSPALAEATDSGLEWNGCSLLSPVYTQQTMFGNSTHVLS